MDERIDERMDERTREHSGVPPSRYDQGDRRGARFVRSQRMTIVNGMLAFVIVVVILQLWLLTASMNAYLGGDTSILVPAALVSIGCLALNAGLLWYLFRLDQ